MNAASEQIKAEHGSAPARPSSLYTPRLWKAGLSMWKWLPEGLAAFLADALGFIYCMVARKRRAVVIENLLPVVSCDRALASQHCHELLKNFARKLVDLWRYEAGHDIVPTALHGWEHFEKARQHGRGVLLLTPHLGNWELGAPLMLRKNMPLLVVTLDEPDPRLTELRKASRMQRGIETLVIGSDMFAFVELIRRLEAGAVVALLVDRPPASSATTVQLFGKPFPASVAPAELARATGCALVPVYLPRTREGYAAHMLPEIAYDRAALRSPEARVALTQKILRAFEPAIRDHSNQWYHFVPIWPR